MARPAARGLKVYISGSNQETNYDNVDGRPASSLLPALNLPSPSVFEDKSPNSPSVLGGSFYDNDESGVYNESLPPSSSSTTPTIPQSSADRAYAPRTRYVISAFLPVPFWCYRLAEFALLEEIRVSQKAVLLFFNNDIFGAKRLLEDKWVQHWTLYLTRRQIWSIGKLQYSIFSPITDFQNPREHVRGCVAQHTSLLTGSDDSFCCKCIELHFVQFVVIQIQKCIVFQDDAKAASKALRDTQASCSKRCRGRFSRSKRTEGK